VRTTNRELKALTGPGGTAVELADGATWTLTRGTRAVGGVIRGGAGTGKTTLLHAITAAADAAGLATVLIDPIAHGRPLPAAAQTGRDRDGAAVLLAQADNDLTDRIAAARPGAPRLVFVDHAEYVLEDRTCKERIERLATLGGKVGIGLTLVCTAPDGVNARLFDGANVVAFDYSVRARTGGFGIDWADLTAAPAHHRDPFTGAVTGFDPHA
jgi:hypothetical protein